ncbi:unnamed protein product [Darwinula stevensoni]|uniref:Scavenger receptor class B member 1 n=1 Tax=Darwinula stevensoni TaxID=69355 RepID=A0A7R9AEG2_9CRUS|nr:unnamed protein product [Darwinula stevensoni]CAG0901944.1 unnamed protein product [Darwinula stevensoni]
MSAIRRWCPYILVVTSVVIAILGLLFNFIIGPKVFENQVYKEIQLVEGTEAMENWLHPPIRIDMKFWFFNITNSEEFLAGAPLELEEIGPYVFEEVITKNVTRRFPNGTLEYYETTRFFFRKEDSIGDQSELITFFNAPLLGVAFLTKTVEEILFQGYNITFLHLLNKALIEDMHYTPEEAAALWDKQLPPDMRDFYFAFYRARPSNPAAPQAFLELPSRLPLELLRSRRTEGMQKFDFAAEGEERVDTYHTCAYETMIYCRFSIAFQTSSMDSGRVPSSRVDVSRSRKSFKVREEMEMGASLTARHFV